MKTGGLSFRLFFSALSLKDFLASKRSTSTHLITENPLLYTSALL